VTKIQAWWQQMWQEGKGETHTDRSLSVTPTVTHALNASSVTNIIRLLYTACIETK